MKKYYLIYIAIFILSITQSYAFTINKDTKILLTNEDSATKQSSNELKKYIKKISSLELDIVKVSNKKEIKKNSIIVGNIDDEQIKKYIKIDKKLKNDSFIIESKDDYIIVAGKDGRGVNYAIFHLLEIAGCKFLSPEFEIVPKKDIVSFKNFKTIQEPRFEYREIFIGEADDIEYSVKNRLNGRLGHRTLKPIPKKYGLSINIYNTFTPSKILSKKEYSKLKCDGQIEYSSKDVQNIVLNSLDKKLQKLTLTEVAMVSLAHQDVKSYCRSKSSVDIIKKYSSPAAPYMLYGIYLAESLASKFPDITFRVSAYQWSRYSPKNFRKFPKNMILSFADIEANFAKALDESENIEIYKDLLGWGEYIDNISIWHYITNFDNYFQPYPDLYALDKNIKIFASIPKVKGVFLQGSYGTYGGELSNLRVWVYSKLLWNPNRDIEDLIEEFVKNYYGSAYKEVLEYLNLLHNSLKESDDKLLVKTSIDSKYLNRESLLKAEEILKRGLKRVKNSKVYSKHLLEIISGVDYINLVRGIDAENREERLQRFKKFLQNSKIRYYAEGKRVDDLSPYLSKNRVESKPPKKAKKLKRKEEWIEFQEYLLKLYSTKLVTDKDASNRVSAYIDGDKDIWAFQLPIKDIPNGRWSIYVDVKISLKDDKKVSNIAQFAFFYGIKGTQTKGGEFIWRLKDQKYRSIKLATIDIKKDKEYLLWIRPPKNNSVKKLYIDRVYFIKE